MLLCSFTVPNELIPFYQETFDLTDLTVSLIPYDSPDVDLATIWQFNLYLAENSSQNATIDFIKNIATKFNLITPDISFSDLDNTDWVTEVQKNFKPLRVNNICIYSSYYQDIVDQNDQETIYINIDPGNAFGTGEHHTTQACLKAIIELSSDHTFSNALDIGCGSAILAIAMAKLVQTKVLAYDIDNDAVNVALDNIAKNNASHLVTAIHAETITHPTIIETSPYDLITCNILANVLIQLAPDIHAITAKDGMIILSGLTIRQLDDVANAYTQYNFRKINTILQDEWCAVIFQKN